MYLSSITNVNCSNITNEKVTQFVENYYLLTIFITGINIIAHSSALIMISKPPYRTNGSLMMTIIYNLSIVEVIFQISVINFSISEYFELDTKILQKNYLPFYTVDTAVRIMIYLIHVFLIARNFVICSLAIHRFEVICKPIGSSKYITYSSWSYIMKIIILTSFLLAYPIIFENSFVYCSTNGWVKRINPLLNYYVVYRIIYTHIIIFLAQTGGPISIVIVLSVLILIKIHKRTEFHRACFVRQSNSSLRHAKWTTDILIVILCFTFLVLEMPAFFSKIPLYIDNKIEWLSAIANICIYLDSLANFFLYFFASKILQIRSSRKSSTLQKKQTSNNTRLELLNGQVSSNDHCKIIKQIPLF